MAQQSASQRKPLASHLHVNPSNPDPVESGSSLVSYNSGYVDYYKTTYGLAQRMVDIAVKQRELFNARIQVLESRIALLNSELADVDKSLLSPHLTPEDSDRYFNRKLTIVGKLSELLDKQVELQKDLNQKLEEYDETKEKSSNISKKRVKRAELARKRKENRNLMTNNNGKREFGLFKSTNTIHKGLPRHDSKRIKVIEENEDEDSEAYEAEEDY